MVSPLISVSEFFGLLSAPVPPVVLDVRWRLGGPPGIDSFHAGHVPDAVYIDMERVLSGPPGALGRHPLPSAAAFTAAMRAAGVSSGRDVVVYDDGDGLPAARAWWDLRYFGHPSVRVLDGGYRAWEEAAMPETFGTAGSDGRAPVPGDFEARPGGMPVLDADAAAALAAGGGLLLDVRAPERYRGETEPIDPVAGHIPGAVNFPIANTANRDGTYRSGREIAAALAKLSPPSAASPAPAGAVPAPGCATPAPGGATPVSVATGVYCGSGITAARAVLALELAGVPAALYVGSWSNWIADPTRPIATSPSP